MINFIADTTSGLPTDIFKRYNIPVIPQIINFGNRSFFEGVDLDNRTFMTMLHASKELPKTAAPPPELFIQEFSKREPLGGTIFCIHPSAEISGTVRSATMAAMEFPNADIRVIDSRTVGSPLATMIQLSAEMAAKSENADTIEQMLKSIIPLSRIYFLLDTLEYLTYACRSSRPGKRICSYTMQ